MRLTLAGVIVTAFLAALTTLILISDRETLAQIRFWTAGSLAGRDMPLLIQMAPIIQLAPPGVGARAGVKSVRATLDRHRQQVGLLCIGKRIRPLVLHDQSLAGQDVEGVAEEIEYGVVVGDEVVSQDLRPVVGVSHARLAA